MARNLPGERIYKRLRTRLMRRHRGHIVVIDPRSGRYFVGKDELAVASRARKQLPGTRFSVFRIGYPSVHKFRRRS